MPVIRQGANQKHNKTVWQYPKSENIYKYRYNHTTRELSIVFINAKQTAYKYQNVPANIYRELQSASSKGHYHAERIKSVFSYVHTSDVR